MSKPNAALVHALASTHNIRKLTREVCLARSEAYREAAEHLLLNWTDDPLEMKEAEKISAKLMRESDRWLSAEPEEALSEGRRK
jgi:hypothetical protein